MYYGKRSKAEPSVNKPPSVITARKDAFASESNGQIPMSKPYRLGITVGRFQTFHKGHQDMINTALALCDRVGIFIGSSQESGTNKNPFSFEMRKQILQKIYADRVDICPLPDIGVGNNSKWGRYVIDRVTEHFGEKPDLLISGKEDRRISWFDGVDGLAIAELYIPKRISISASHMRQLLVEDRFDDWKKYCDERLWDSFSEMRKITLATYKNTSTSSI